MTLNQFLIKCNMAGIKVQRVKAYAVFNGRLHDLLICTKPYEWELNLLVEAKEIEADSHKVFDTAWITIERILREKEPHKYSEKSPEQINELWEAAADRAKKEREHARGINGRVRGRITR